MPVLFEHLPDALAQLHDVGVELPPLQAPGVSVRRLDLRLLLLDYVGKGPENKINSKVVKRRFQYRSMRFE